MQPILKISLEDIKSNWKSLNTCSNGKASAVIKANAYGMGMLKVAGALLEAGCNYFYVANINEGIELRKKYKSHKIFIAIFEGYLDGYQKTYEEYNLIPIINSLEQLERLNQYAIQENKPKAILNIDTGMNRLGLNKEETCYLIKNKDILNNINWDYIMSHLANAQEKDNHNNLIQLNKITKFSKNFPSIKISLANTGGIRLGKEFCLDQTRPGIGLYGIDDLGKKVEKAQRKTGTRFYDNQVSRIATTLSDGTSMTTEQINYLTLNNTAIANTISSASATFNNKTIATAPDNFTLGQEAFAVYVNGCW